MASRFCRDEAGIEDDCWLLGLPYQLAQAFANRLEKLHERLDIRTGVFLQSLGRR